MLERDVLPFTMWSVRKTSIDFQEIILLKVQTLAAAEAASALETWGFGIRGVGLPFSRAPNPQSRPCFLGRHRAGFAVWV